MADAVEEQKLAARFREAQFLAEVGRGLARERRTQAEAVTWLRRAENTGRSTSATAQLSGRPSPTC